MTLDSDSLEQMVLKALQATTDPRERVAAINDAFGAFVAIYDPEDHIGAIDVEGDGPADVYFDMDGAVYVDGDLFEGEDEELVRVIVDRGEQVRALA